MVFVNSFVDTNVFLFTYMFLYNISLVVLFWYIFNVIATQFNTLYSFNGFSFNSYGLLLLTTLLFSMAGVPPFAGFFSKLFILTLLTTNQFFILYLFFFILLFLGLYFYVQNIRFLHSTNPHSFSYAYVGNERVVLSFHYFSLFVLLLVLLGIFFLDDVLLYFTWLLN